MSGLDSTKKKDSKSRTLGDMIGISSTENEDQQEILKKQLSKLNTEITILEGNLDRLAD